VEPDETEFGKYDFVICSEVLEHVAPPVDRAFRTLAGLLKPSGVLILTIPFSLNTHTIEHFRTKGSLGLAELDGKTVAVGRSNDGSYEVFDNLVFHGGHGSTLEMRLFSEAGLRTNLADCGLTNVRFESKGSEKFGVHFSGPCSLPIVAGRQSFSLDVAGIAELTEQLVTAQRALKESRWLQLGRRLGLGPRIREPKV
jgi:SAM-dependent methyltransferase